MSEEETTGPRGEPVRGKARSRSQVPRLARQVSAEHIEAQGSSNSLKQQPHNPTVKEEEVGGRGDALGIS